MQDPFYLIQDPYFRKEWRRNGKWWTILG